MALQLGEGGFAIVRQIKHTASKESYAVKEIKVAVLDERTRLTIQDEIAALKLLRGGPHIIQLHDVFQEKTRIFMVMEEMKGGDLLQRIVEKQVYTEREARQTCKTIFAAIGYIHNKQIAHRDLKPENILLVVSLTVSLHCSVSFCQKFVLTSLHERTRRTTLVSRSQTLALLRG